MADSFAITCTTCRSRLRVKDRSAIGQILACPNCQSMVMVQAPSDAIESREAPESSQPAAVPGKPAAVPGKPAAVPSQPSAVPNSRPDDTQVDAPKSPRAERPGPVDAGTTASASVGQGGALPGKRSRFREDFPEEEWERNGGADHTGEDVTTGPASGPLEPDWASRPATGKLKQVLIITAAAVGGIALALLVVMFVARPGQSSASTEPAGAAGTSGQTVPEGPTPTADGSRSRQTATTDGTASATDERAATDTTQAPPDASTSKADPNEDPSSPSGDPPDTIPSSDAVSRDQPPDVDMENPPGLTPRAPQTGSPAEDVEPSSGVPSTESPPHDTRADSTGSSDERASSDPTSTESRDADIEARLAVPLAAIEFDGIPLLRFVGFVSELAAVPVTIDSEVLLALGIDEDTPLDIHDQAVTVRQLLERAVEPLGLICVIDRHDVRITGPASLRSELSTTRYSLSDLAANADQQLDLSQQLKAMVDSSQWDTAGGPAKLDIDGSTWMVTQNRLAHFRVQQFLDRLRSARGLQVRSDLPLPLLAARPTFQDLLASLQQPVTMNFPKPATVHDVLKFVHIETDLRILVDWAATARLGWLPSSETELVGGRQPLGDQLDLWLDKSGLGFRSLGGTTIEITSRDDLVGRPSVEFYPLKPSIGPASSVIEKLESSLGSEHFRGDRPDGGVYYDKAGNCLVVRLQAPLQRTAYGVLKTAGVLAER